MTKIAAQKSVTSMTKNDNLWELAASYVDLSPQTY